MISYAALNSGKEVEGFSRSPMVVCSYIHSTKGVYITHMRAHRHIIQ